MSDLSDLCGWIDDPQEVEQAMESLPFPVFSDIHSQIKKDSGKNKKVLLYDIIEKVSGSFPIRKQTIGDCVAHGAAYAVDAIKCVDIFIKGENEKWVARTSTEDIYWGSRNVIGKGRLGNRDGSFGIWAAKYVNQYGALPRAQYGNIDLTNYSGSKARTWGRKGHKLPQEFVEIVKDHPVITVSQVRSYNEVRDLIANGYAVTIASSQGFSSRRDSEGFARPQGTWHHQMCILGVDDAYKRPGVLVQNSWGKWNGGPKRNNQPDGSFWVDADDIERKILKTGDCWAYSGYEGFEKRVNKLNTRII